MRKYIIISSSIITIIICGWLVLNRLEFLDIPSNKNDWYAMHSKRKIQERTDIDECEKKILINNIDKDREYKKRYSGIAFQTQIIAFIVIVIQLILLFTLLIPPIKKIKQHKRKYSYILGLILVIFAFIDFINYKFIYRYSIIFWIIGVIFIMLSDKKIWVKILTSILLPIIIILYHIFYFFNV